MFRAQFASIIKSNLQTVVAATGVHPRCGLNKSRVGIMYYIPWFNRFWWLGGVACEWWWIVVLCI